MRALRVVGSSGAGKTALAGRIAEKAAGDWLVVQAPAFRIHASLPLFAARRTARLLLEALGDSAGRYSSGLTLDREQPDDFREAFVRIVEGVTLDHRLLLVLDDAQWTDAQSRELLALTATSLADRSIVLLTTERSGESSEPALSLVDKTIALGNLSEQSSIEIVRSIYPAVSADVAIAIASATRGHAMDLVAVATAARESGVQNVKDVGASTRRVVVRDLALLDPELRTFLQLAALIDEPIEFSLLAQLWPRDTLLEMISHVSGRYLVEGNDGLRFVHATVMESVLETIPIEIPLRHRIVDALKRLPAPRLEDLERMAAQYAACGDREAEREVLVKLADAAAAKSLFSLSANALERALAIASPAAADIVPTYAQLSQFYNVMGREPDAIRICQRALSEARAAGISDGLGAIVASIVLAQWHLGLRDEARATLARYEGALSADADRANLVSIGEYISMHCVDLDNASRYRLQYERYASGAPAVVTIRHHVANAFLAMRTGDEHTALEHIKSANRAAETAPIIYATMPLAATVLHAFRFRGMTAAQELTSQVDQEQRASIILTVRCQIMVARGEFADVEEVIGDRLQGSADSQFRRELLGARYTAAALGGIDGSSPLWQPAQPYVAAFEAGERASMILPIVTAALIALGAQSKQPSRARRLLDDVLKAAGQPPDFMVFFYPVLIAIAAKSLGAKDALEAMTSAQTLWSDEQPWTRAHQLLARGVAAAALGRSESRELLGDAAERFTTLGATHLATLASEAIGKQHAASRDGTSRPNNTTRREREIASLVAEGLTNREIAEKLVLSERTVEGHIANLFAKVNVSSRTQLATWYMRTLSSVA